MAKRPRVYIMANQRDGTLYTGVTSNLAERVQQHRTGTVPGFTSRCDCKLLVWCEHLPTTGDAITREKQVKGGSRQKKLALVEVTDPTWTDLSHTLNA